MPAPPLIRFRHHQPHTKNFGANACDFSVRGRVRYRWSNIKPRSYTWEQAFSTDGGKIWETNWITQGTRID
jgi:hypothetical protein